MENYNDYTVHHLTNQNEIQVLGGTEELNEDELKSIAKEFNVGNFYIINQEVWGKYFEYYKYKIIYGIGSRSWQGIDEGETVKIEILSDSMNDGTRKSFSIGDQAFCSVIPTNSIFSRESLNKIFCFFHRTKGIIFKKIKSYNIDTGEILLTSLNSDKKKFPDFIIYIEDCNHILKINKILRNLNVTEMKNNEFKSYKVIVKPEINEIHLIGGEEKLTDLEMIEIMSIHNIGDFIYTENHQENKGSYNYIFSYGKKSKYWDWSKMPSSLRPKNE